MNGPLVELVDVDRLFDQRRSWRALAGLRWQRPPPIEVLRGASLSIDAGEWYCILGKNGAGKTTILRLVAGLLRPSAGSVRVAQLDVTTQEREARAQVGYALADERSFHWRLSVAENLEFFANLEGMRGRVARERIDHLLGRLDLGSQRDLSFSALSTGMKQRLALARALLSHPRVMLMDEPTRSLDAGHAADVMLTVREEVAHEGGCVVMVTHQLEQALSESDRIGVLRDGAIAWESTADALSTDAPDASGLTVAVRGLPADAISSIALIPGIRDLQVASSAAGEQVLEIWLHNDSLPIERIFTELTNRGATVSRMQRGTPLQALLDRVAGVDRQSA